MERARDHYRGIWKYVSLVYVRCAAVAADLNDLRRTDKIFGVLGFGGALHFHLPNTKSTLRYLVDPETPVVLSKIGNSISQQIDTTWANTDTRLRPNDFYKNNLIQEFAIID